MSDTTPRIRLYPKGSGFLKSVTSSLSFLFGYEESDVERAVKSAVTFALRQQKLNPDFYQKDTIENALQARPDTKDGFALDGVLTHTPVQHAIENKPLPPVIPDQVKGLNAFLNFRFVNNIKPIFMERRVESHRYGYAGRVDFHGYLNGKLVVLDFKTGAPKWYWGLQFAYKQAIKEMGFAEPEATYILRLQRNFKYELIEYTDPVEMRDCAFRLVDFKRGNVDVKEELAPTEEELDREAEVPPFAVPIEV